MGILKPSLRFAMEVTELQRDLSRPLRSDYTRQAVTKKHCGLIQRVPLLQIEKFIDKIDYTDTVAFTPYAVQQSSRIEP